MRAMTWWDHETESIWSQPWGMAIHGPLEGTRLRLIPARIVPWFTWLDDHPDTLVMEVEGRGSGSRESFSAGYVIGITLGEHARAYPFKPASKAGVINDWVGPFPLLVSVDPDTKAVYVYLRSVGDQQLEFTRRDGRLIDVQTGSVWEPARGLAVEGPLRAEVLQQVPYITSFDWAWEDFYPHSEFYAQDG